MEGIPEDFKQEMNHEMTNSTERSTNCFPAVPHVHGHESAAQRYTVKCLQAGFPDR